MAWGGGGHGMFGYTPFTWLYNKHIQRFKLTKNKRI